MLDELGWAGGGRAVVFMNCLCFPRPLREALCGAVAR